MARITHLSCILLTHWHTDHTGGLPALLAQYPQLATAVYKAHPDPRLDTPVDMIVLFSPQGTKLGWPESLTCPVSIKIRFWPYLAQHQLSISQVLLTHWHTDHTGGLPALLAQYPQMSGREQRS
jgi:glyoxylase-like metal-dependent hydrolase (beta-lactamase superfamily II)